MSLRFILGAILLSCAQFSCENSSNHHLSSPQQNEFSDFFKALEKRDHRFVTRVITQLEVAQEFPFLLDKGLRFPLTVTEFFPVEDSYAMALGPIPGSRQSSDNPPRTSARPSSHSQGIVFPSLLPPALHRPRLNAEKSIGGGTGNLPAIGRRGQIVTELGGGATAGDFKDRLRDSALGTEPPRFRAASKALSKEGLGLALDAHVRSLGGDATRDSWQNLKRQILDAADRGAEVHAVFPEGVKVDLSDGSYFFHGTRAGKAIMTTGFLKAPFVNHHRDERPHAAYATPSYLYAKSYASSYATTESEVLILSAKTSGIRQHTRDTVTLPGNESPIIFSIRKDLWDPAADFQ